MLGAVLTVLMIAALILLLLFVVLVCLPVRLDLAFNTQADPPVDMKIGLLGGALAVPVSASTPETPKQTPQKPARKPKRKKAGQVRLEIMPMLRHLPRLLARLIGIVKFETLRATIGFGCDSPADTGMIYGMLSPFERTLGNRRKCRVVLHPDFDQAKFESQGRLAAHFVPAAVIPPLIGFGWRAVLKPRLDRWSR